MASQDSVDEPEGLSRHRDATPQPDAGGQDAMSVTDDAIAKIRDLISSGRLQPGDRVPPEHEPAELLGISRSSTAGSCHSAEPGQGALRAPGEGTYVSSLEPRLLLSGMSFAIELMQEQGWVRFPRCAGCWSPLPLPWQRSAFRTPRWSPCVRAWWE